MRAFAFFSFLALLSGCPRRETSHPDISPKPDAAVSPLPPNADPWARARIVAERTHARGVERWNDDLPYLFQAEGTRGLLVHNDAVISERGPHAVAGYLRDLGVLEGKTLDAHAILTLLYVLHAFPQVEDLPEQSAADSLAPEPLRPRIERVNGHARVILTYQLPSDPGPYRGVVPMMRETLDIGPNENSDWVGERFDFARP